MRRRQHDDGDGCSAGCRSSRAGRAPTAGQPCTPVVVARCGDGAVNAGEQCDDGATPSGDGCSATCKLELGWTCPTPGQALRQVRVLRRRHRAGGESQRAMRRRQRRCPATAAPASARSSRATRARRRACRARRSGCAATARSIRARRATTATPLAATAARPTAPSSSRLHLSESGRRHGGPCTLAPQNDVRRRILGPERAVRRRQHDADRRLLGTCGVEPGYTCRRRACACTQDRVLRRRRRQPRSRRRVRRRQRDSRRRLQRALQARAELRLPDARASRACPRSCAATATSAAPRQCDDGNTRRATAARDLPGRAGWLCPVAGRALHRQAVRRRHHRRQRAVRRRQHRRERRLQRDLQARAGLRLHDGRRHRASATRPICGDGVKEGFEQCDDGNLIPYDGCSPTCTIEPKCAGGHVHRRCAATGSSSRKRRATTATPRTATAAAPTCTIEPGFDVHRDRPDRRRPTLVDPDPLPRHALRRGTSGPGRQRRHRRTFRLQIDPTAARPGSCSRRSAPTASRSS